MKLSNSLKALTWILLFRRPRRRGLRRSPSAAPVGWTAEFLEARRLLSGTVNVVQLGSSLVLSADANGTVGSTPTFALHRINASTVQVDDAGSGTLIAKNGAFGSATSAQTFSIGNVVDVIVNLGTGFDTFRMFDLSTLGSVVVLGKGILTGGALGQEIDIHTQNADMTIGGSIVESLGLQTGSAASHYDIHAAGGHHLTICGSVVLIDRHTGADSEMEVFSSDDSPQNSLLVKGAIAVAASGAGDGETFFAIESFGGSTTVNGPVSVVELGSAPMVFQVLGEGTDELPTGSTILLKSVVAFVASGGGPETMSIETDNFGEPGGITIEGLVTATFVGSDVHALRIDASGGPILIKGSVIAVNFGSALSLFSIDGAADSSPITILGSVTFLDRGTGDSQLSIESDSNASPISIGSYVLYDNSTNTVGHSTVRITGSTDDGDAPPITSIKGFLTLLLSNSSTASNGQSNRNFVYLGENEGDKGLGYGLTVGGLTTIIGGLGIDEITLAEGRFGLGAVIDTQLSRGASAEFPADHVTIKGSLFGAAAVFTMLGPGAQLDINNGDAFQLTEFLGAFVATLLGANSRINVAVGCGAGFSPVKFDSVAVIAGSFHGNSVFEENPDNVTFFQPTIFPVLIFFSRVESNCD